jgi:hypothetical protein
MTNYNIRPFKGRTIEVGDPIKAYRNLHQGDWSVVATSGPYRGLVVAHSDELPIWGPRFEVSLAGRERVLRDGKKNVHAFIVGTLGGHMPRGLLLNIRNEVTYSPWMRPYFVAHPRRLKSDHDRVPYAMKVTAGGLATLDAYGKAWVYAPRGLS